MTAPEKDPDRLTVEPTEEGMRLDTWLTLHYPSYSRTYFQKLIKEGLVLIDGERVKKGIKVWALAEIEVEFTLTPELSLEPEAIPLDILYEDDYLLAINKPAGMVVHPGAGNWSGTFVNALLHYCATLKGADPLRPGIVHRLDKDTSGVLLAAKSEWTQRQLVELFASRQIQKEYVAICVGNPGNRTIQAKIGRHPIKRKEMTVIEEGGKEALTRCEVIAARGSYAFVRLFPHTGRTHQLRVHLKTVGTPILGDLVYGNKEANQKTQLFRQLLHAESLSFVHPATGKHLVIKAPLPEDMLEWTRYFNYP